MMCIMPYECIITCYVCIIESVTIPPVWGMHTFHLCDCNWVGRMIYLSSFSPGSHG